MDQNYSEIVNSSISSSNHEDRKRERLQILIEFFPLVPIPLFESLFDLTGDDYNNVVNHLLSLDDNHDIIIYLTEINEKSSESDEEENYQSSEGTISHQVNCESSPEDDSLLMNIENEENDKCLVLGRMFLQEAHNKFSMECGTSAIDIASIPPEISEMNWRPSDNTMLLIYRAFMTDLGVIDDTPKVITLPTDTLRKENLSMREIMEIEQAMTNSLISGRNAIKNNDGLVLQIAALKSRYPQMSNEALEDMFVSCNMDTMKTINELSNKGHTSFVGGSKSVANEGTSQTLPVANKSIKTKRMKERMDAETRRIAHIKEKLGLLGDNKQHSQIKSYWNEELRQSFQRLKWLDEQDGLAVADHRRDQFGNRLLDLHGLTCASALVVVENRLEELRVKRHDRSKLSYLTIICGRGLHSVKGRSRLKPAVREYLTREHIHFSEPFDGTFRVPLRQLQRQP